MAEWEGPDDERAGADGSTGTDRLARAYRRLLWAYPRDYRRIRGAEMLTTLLDATEAGRRRPQFRDALNLVAGGLRFRVYVRRHPGHLAVAAAAALCVAAVGAWIGGMAGWHRGTSLPTTAEVVAAASVAVPDAERRLPSRIHKCDRHCVSNPSDDLVVFRGPYVIDDMMPRVTDPDRPRTTDPATNHVYLPLTMPHADMPAIAMRAHDRLAAAGWRVSPVRTHFDMRYFWAVKGDLTLRFEGRGTTQPESPAVAIIVHHNVPPATLPAAAAGAVPGLLVGWWLAAFVLRRYGHHRKGIRSAMMATGLPGLTAIGMLAGDVALAIAAGLVTADGTGPAQAYLLRMPVDQYQLGVLVVAMLVCVGLALTRPSAAPHLVGHQAVNSS